MKHLKIYDEYEPTEYDIDLDIMKKLLIHIEKIFNKLGLDYKNYVDRGKWEIEFNENDDYIFYISLKIDGFKKHNILLELKKSLAHNNSILNILPEYFNNINGINYMKYDNSHTYSYQIKVKDVDKVINQITLEDLKLKINSNKYNL